MGQKINPSVVRLGNRLSWKTIFYNENRQFTTLFFNYWQQEFIIVKMLFFFSVLSGNPIIKTSKINSIFIRINSISSLKLKPSYNFRINTYNKLKKSFWKLCCFTYKLNLYLYDFNYLQFKTQKNISLLTKLMYRWDFNFLQYNSAQIISYFIGKQIESSSKYRIFNFKSNFKKSIFNIIKLFLNAKLKKQNSICGLKLICSGRLKKTKSGRKQKLIIIIGRQLLTQNYSSCVDIGFYTGKTKFGKFSLKTTIVYANK